MALNEEIKANFSITGYTVKNKISESLKYATYQGLNLADSSTVVIKTSSSKYPSKQNRAEIQNEYLIQKSLPPGVSPEVIDFRNLDYGRVALITKRYGITLSDYMALSLIHI